jgi:uncharacterized protein YbjT (DUF2867 family)
MIVVTAPTSNIGRQVLENILDSGEAVRVIARDPSRLPAPTRERVDVIQGSHSDLNVVTKAFRGADAVFWLVPADPRAPSAEAAYVDFSRPGCEAFQSERVKRVVGISALGRGWTKDAGYVTATLKMDDLIATTGVSYRALACAGFMDNVLRQKESIRQQGTYFWPVPADLKMPTCAARDIAAVAARLLLDRTWSGVDSIPILGPEDLSWNQMMAIMSDVLEKPVRYHLMAMDDLRGMMIRRGASEAMAQAMVNMMTAANEGMNNMVKRTPASALDTPTTFRQWCTEVLKPAVSS